VRIVITSTHAAIAGAKALQAGGMTEAKHHAPAGRQHDHRNEQNK
jgi:hypothetical protein